jgi:hypothetical protein
MSTDNDTNEQELKNVPDIANELQNIYHEDYLETFPEDERKVHAQRILLSRLMQGQLVEADPYEIHVLDYEEPRTIERDDDEDLTIANVYGIGQRIADDGDEPLGYIQATFFNEDASAVQGAERGKTYRTVFTGAYDEGVYDVNAVSNTKFQNGDQDDLDPVEAAEALFDRTLIADAENEISQTPQDVKLVKGNVVMGRVGSSDSGFRYGLYQVMDDSVSTGTEGERPEVLSVMCRPSQVRFGSGSEVYVIGRITDDDEYGVGMNADAIIPRLEIPIDEQQLAPEDGDGDEDGGENAEVDSGDINFSDFE